MVIESILNFNYMKYANLIMLLSLAEITLKAGFFGKKPHASFDEDQLQAIDDALAAKNSTTDLEQKISELEAANQNLQASNDAVANVLEQALELNGLKQESTMEKSIEALGQKCKEYGESKNRHTFEKIDGTDDD